MLAQPLTHEDVEGVYAGLRPLLTGESEGTSQLSREHTVAVPVPGLVAVAGGKYTTYRVMARDAIDAAARGLDRPSRRPPPHVTPLARRARLPGAVEPARAAGRRERAARRPDRAPAAALRHADRRPARDDRRATRSWAEPLPGAEDYLAVEVLYAATHEGALHLDDVLARRTRISIETWDRGLEAAEPAARLMAERARLGRGRRSAVRSSSTAQRVDAERRSQEQPDDRAADLERLSAPDVLSRH